VTIYASHQTFKISTYNTKTSHMISIIYSVYAVFYWAQNSSDTAACVQIFVL